MAVVETLKQGPAEAPHTAVIPQSDRQGLHSLQVTFLPVTLSWLSLQGIRYRFPKSEHIPPL